jgi:hypothetical protein
MTCAPRDLERRRFPLDPSKRVRWGRLAGAMLVFALGCGGAVDGERASDGPPVDASVTQSMDASSGLASDGASSMGSSGDADAVPDGPSTGCPADDSGTALGAQSGRVPLVHRPSSLACPQGRAAETPTSTPSCVCPTDGGRCPCGACTKDSDCTEGKNGRCGIAGPIAYRTCSYDECTTDNDCAEGTPCDCRASSTSSAPNSCISGGNCAVDSDCGPAGYCSPSLVNQLCTCPGSPALCGDSGGGCYEGTGTVVGLPPGPGWTPVACECGDSCGHAYFCHTRCDECVDDSDCGGQGTCDYDVLKHVWACAQCEGIP